MDERGRIRVVNGRTLVYWPGMPESEYADENSWVRALLFNGLRRVPNLRDEYRVGLLNEVGACAAEMVRLDTTDLIGMNYLTGNQLLYRVRRRWIRVATEIAAHAMAGNVFRIVLPERPLLALCNNCEDVVFRSPLDVYTAGDVLTDRALQVVLQMPVVSDPRLQPEVGVELPMIRASDVSLHEWNMFFKAEDVIRLFELVVTCKKKWIRLKLNLITETEWTEAWVATCVEMTDRIREIRARRRIDRRSFRSSEPLRMGPVRRTRLERERETVANAFHMMVVNLNRYAAACLREHETGQPQPLLLLLEQPQPPQPQQGAHAVADEDGDEDDEEPMASPPEMPLIRPGDVVRIDTDEEGIDEAEERAAEIDRLQHQLQIQQVERAAEREVRRRQLDTMVKNARLHLAGRKRRADYYGQQEQLLQERLTHLRARWRAHEQEVASHYYPFQAGLDLSFVMEGLNRPFWIKGLKDWRYMMDPDETDGVYRCSMCMDAPADVVLIPCGHIVGCVKCSHELATCSHCRFPVLHVRSKDVQVFDTSDGPYEPPMKVPPEIEQFVPGEPIPFDPVDPLFLDYRVDPRKDFPVQGPLTRFTE